MAGPVPVEKLANANPFKSGAVERGREKREVALEIAKAALPEILEGQRAAATRINDLLTRDGEKNVQRINGVLELGTEAKELSVRQMAEAIADPATLFALAEASDRVGDILWASGIEEKMKLAFIFLREAGVDISEFEGVVHKDVLVRVREVIAQVTKKPVGTQYDELLALMDLPYNQVSAGVIRTALGFGIKATADSRATVQLSDDRVKAVERAAQKMGKLLAKSKDLKKKYDGASLPVSEIMDRASAVRFGRENGLADPATLAEITQSLQADIDRLQGKGGKMGLKAYDKLVKKYLGDLPSAMEEASQAMAGTHATSVATSANARMMIQKAESYYSLAAAEAQRMLMVHQTLTIVMNYAIGRMNRDDRDKAMGVVSQMVRLINAGKYDEAFVLGASQQVLPPEIVENILPATITE